MNLKIFSIAFLLATSPILQAGPLEWMKNNPGKTAAISIIGSAATVIYLSTQNDGEIDDKESNSPVESITDLSHAHLLNAARSHHASNRTSVERNTAIKTASTTTQQASNSSPVENLNDLSHANLITNAREHSNNQTPAVEDLVPNFSCFEKYAFKDEIKTNPDLTKKAEYGCLKGGNLPLDQSLISRKKPNKENAANSK